MTTEMPRTNQVARNELEKRRAGLSRFIFGKRVEGHLSFVVASDLLPHNVWPLHANDKSALAEAIRKSFADRDPIQQEIILRSYRDCYQDLPVVDALLAIEKHFENPGDAMRASVIPKRRFVGFWEQWK